MGASITSPTTACILKGGTGREGRMDGKGEREGRERERKREGGKGDRDTQRDFLILRNNTFWLFIDCPHNCPFPVSICKVSESPAFQLSQGQVLGTSLGLFSFLTNGSLKYPPVMAKLSYLIMFKRRRN